MLRFVIFAFVLATGAVAQDDTSCFVYDSASRMGPSGLCKPGPCKSVIPGYQTVEACCSELVKLLSWQNKGDCASKSYEKFQIPQARGGAPAGAGAAAAAAAPKVCPCPRIFRQVCGKDGKTYDNECLAKCAGAAVTGEGPCAAGAAGAKAAAAPKVCPCPRIFRQVCGKDGKTYDNECLAKCAGAAVTGEGPCAAGAKAAGAKSAVGAKFNVKKDSDIKMADLTKDGASYYRVCGPVADVQAACAKVKECAGFVMEAATSCGYLKKAAKDVGSRKGWDVYIKA